MSKACCATSFFSLVFSCRSWFSSTAWLGSRPPNRRRHRNNVVCVIPWRFATWATVAPGASLSLTMATICSSLNRLLRMQGPPRWRRSCHNLWS